MIGDVHSARRTLDEGMAKVASPRLLLLVLCKLIILFLLRFSLLLQGFDSLGHRLYAVVFVDFVTPARETALVAYKLRCRALHHVMLC